jgi:murein DD-endopeptidase MepM/ murein hydrolase activator NlpD
MSSQTTWTINPKQLSQVTAKLDLAGEKVYPIDKNAKGYYESQGSVKGHIAKDIAVVEGSDVYSPMAGTVLRTNVMDSRGYGNLIEILLPSGEIMYFAHLSEFLVKPGQFVQAGEKIALTGNTFSAPGSSTGPHLHFAVKDTQGDWLEPEKFFGGEVKDTSSDTSGQNLTLQRTAARMNDVQKAQEGDIPAYYESDTSVPYLSSPSDGLTSSAAAGFAAATGLDLVDSASESETSDELPEGTTMVKIASLGALGDLEVPVRWPRLIAIGLGALLLVVGLIGVSGKTYKLATSGSTK